MTQHLPTLLIAIFVVFTAGLAGREIPRFPHGLPLFLVVALLGTVTGPSLALAAHVPLFLAIPYGAVFLMVLALSYAVLGEQKNAAPVVLPRLQVEQAAIARHDAAEEAFGRPARLSQIDAQARPTTVAPPRKA